MLVFALLELQLQSSKCLTRYTQALQQQSSLNTSVTVCSLGLNADIRFLIHMVSKKYQSNDTFYNLKPDMSGAAELLVHVHIVETSQLKYWTWNCPYFQPMYTFDFQLKGTAWR